MRPSHRFCDDESSGSSAFLSPKKNTKERRLKVDMLAESETHPDRVSIFDTAAVDALPAAKNSDPHLVRGLRNRLLKRFLDDSAAVGDFPDSQQLVLHCLDLYHRCDSEVDGATRLLFRTDAGMLLESVILRIASGRTTVCVSSQIGCAAACDFCATGRMGVTRNLTSAQILDQILQAGQLVTAEQRRLQNIVFMGMGEPFHNEDQLYASLDSLTDVRQFNRTPRSLLISTVGIPDAMIRCAQRFPEVNLALSLHSVDPKIRTSIIPLAARYSLDDLNRAVSEVNRLQRSPVMIEYLMLRDLNDSPAQAQELAEWIRGLNVHVNLIPFNPIDDAPHLTASTRETIHKFSASLKNVGFKVTIRYSLGSDIAAACGQLVRKENRFRTS